MMIFLKLVIQCNIFLVSPLIIIDWGNERVKSPENWKILQLSIKSILAQYQMACALTGNHQFWRIMFLFLEGLSDYEELRKAGFSLSL